MHRNLSPFRALGRRSIFVFAVLGLHCLWLESAALRAAVFVSTDSVGQAVPDGDAAGLARQITIDVGAANMSIQDVNVTLDLDGVGFGGSNGDLYVFLEHEGRTAVLLNRPGRSQSNPFGYSGNGLDGVVFDDEATRGDVHVYEATLGTDYTAPDPLAGAWAPDGRATDPAATLDSDSRSQLLNVFDGVNPNGVWTLFVADLESGGTSELDFWSLSITAVPEPQSATLAVGALLVVGAVVARKRRNARAIR